MPQSRVIARQAVVSSAEAARRLGIAGGDPVLRLYRLRFARRATLPARGNLAAVAERLEARAPYTDLVPRIADLFGDRMVWGSDWPHTTFSPDALPPYVETWQPVADALGRVAAETLRARRPPIYS